MLAATEGIRHFVIASGAMPKGEGELLEDFAPFCMSRAELLLRVEEAEGVVVAV